MGWGSHTRDDFHDAGIFFSYATGNVGGGGGGLVRFNRGSIIASYATGNVTGGDEYSGGLVGVNRASAGSFFEDSGTIIASYATGNVSGSGYLGGLAGSAGSYIYASYSTGRVSGEGNVGGFSGFAGALAYDNYWDTLSSGTSTGIGEGSASKHGLTSELGIEGNSTRELQSPTGYTGIYADWNTDAHISELQSPSAGGLTRQILAAWNAGRDNSDPSTRLSDFWDFGDEHHLPAPQGRLRWRRRCDMAGVRAAARPTIGAAPARCGQTRFAPGSVRTAAARVPSEREKRAPGESGRHVIKCYNHP